MIDFTINVEVDNFLIDINTSNTISDNLSSGTAIIEINDQDYKILNLESSFINNINNLTIEKYNDYNLVLNNMQYESFPNEISMSIVTGNLHVSRIDGLDEYLNTIPIDGGTP